jgi:hypothetical protein
VEGFGEGKGFESGKSAPIHFGDTAPAGPVLSDNESKLAPDEPAKTVTEKIAGVNGKGNGAGVSSRNGVAKPAAKSAAKSPQKNGSAKVSASAKPVAKNTGSVKAKTHAKSAPAASGKRR